MAVSDYEPIIQDAAREWNVDPVLVKAVMQQESGGNPTKNGRPIVSSAGAGGLMQIMPDTARGLGVADVHDPHQAIYGGTKLISQLLDKYQNPSHALMAYNARPSTVDAFLAGQGDLPAETKAYVPAVTAHYQRFAKGDVAARPGKPSAPAEVSDDEFLSGIGKAAPVAKAAPEPSDDEFLTGIGKAVGVPPPVTTTPNDTSGVGRDEYGQPLHPLAAAPPGPSAWELSDQAQAAIRNGAASVKRGVASLLPAETATDPGAPTAGLGGALEPNVAEPNMGGVSANGSVSPAAVKMGAAVAQGFGSEPLGMNNRLVAALRSAGIYGPAPGSGSPVQMLNEGVMTPAGIAVDAGLRGVNALVRGGQEAVSQAGAAAGSPRLGRELAAIPEAFMGASGEMAHPPGAAGYLVNRLTGGSGAPTIASTPVNRLTPGGAATVDGPPALNAAPPAAGAPAINAPAFVPPGTSIPTLDRIRQLIEADNQVAANRPAMVPPGAAQPPNPLTVPAPREVPAVNRLAPSEPVAAPSAVPAAPPVETPIPNGLTPEQVAEFRNIPDQLPPLTREIQTREDAAARADQIINHFASIGNKEPIPGAEGSLPTITGNSGLATLYRAVRSSDTPVPFTTLEKAGKDRAGAGLAELVKTPEDLKAGEAEVEARTAPMREKAFADKTEADPTPVVGEIKRILASPSGMSDAVKSSLTKVLDKLVDKDGNIRPRATDPEQLYGLDKAIRKDISPLAAGTTSDARLAAHELMSVQAALRPVINDAAPGFADYMKTYSDMQRPLDEMRYLQSRDLTNTMDETTLAKVHSMLNDISKQKRAPGIKLPDSLSPETLDKLQAIHDQMQRENFTSTAGKALGSDTFQNAATNTTVGRLAGHIGNSLIGTGLGAATDLLAGGGGLHGAVAGNMLAAGAKTLAERQASKATARTAAGQKMLMEELRDRLLNIDNKGVRSLSGVGNK